jgi:hypothetical protein
MDFGLDSIFSLLLIMAEVPRYWSPRAAAENAHRQIHAASATEVH